jgi:hypothetical protein
MSQGPRKYEPMSLCEAKSHPVRARANLVSVDAELLNGMPHGLVLIDQHCREGGLLVDFFRTHLDPSLKLLEDHLFEFHRATGTFRGRIKVDRENRRRYLWLESVVNFKCDPCSEPYEDKPIHLPDAPLPTFPPNR